MTANDTHGASARRAMDCLPALGATSLDTGRCCETNAGADRGLPAADCPAAHVPYPPACGRGMHTGAGSAHHGLVRRGAPPESRPAAPRSHGLLRHAAAALFALASLAALRKQDMIPGATDDGLRASSQSEVPASRRCAPDSRSVSAPTLGLAHTALALLLLAGLAFTVPARAATFVSNIGQTDNAYIATTSQQEVSQGFTTGSSGAILTTIEIRMETAFAPPVTNVPTVTLHKDSATSAAVATLAGPSSIAHAAANYTFTAPANTALDASATYYVVLERGPQSGLRGRVTYSDNEDSGGSTGWSVANGILLRTGSSTGAFTAHTQALMIRVNGTTRTVTVPSAPQNLVATEGEGLVWLSWSAPATNGGVALTRYEYRHAAGTTVPTSTSWTTVADSNDPGSSTADETRVLVRGLTNATAYAFEVRAANSAGGGTEAGPVTATPAAVVCAMPNFGTRDNIWTGNLTVARFYDDGTNSIYGFTETNGGLDDKDFTIGSNDYEVDTVVDRTVRGRGSNLNFSLDSDLTSAEKAALRLHVCNAAYDFSAARGPARENTYGWFDPGLGWSLLSTRTLYLSLPANTAARGKPAISGRGASTGQTLTAVKGTITDVDGVPVDANGVPTTFTYQWVRVDGATETDISGATSRTYTLGADDLGKTLKVKVSFTDALGREETGGTSDAYPRSGTITAPTVPGAPQNLMASAGDGRVVLTWSAPASDGGSAISEYDYRYAAGTTVPLTTPWTTVADGIDAGMSTADERGVTIGSLTNATAYAFEVRAVNSAGDGTKAGPVTATPAAVACAGPNFGTRRNIWTGTVTVGTITVSSVTYAYGFVGTIGGLNDKDFTVGSNPYEIDAVSVVAIGADAGTLGISLNADLTSAEKAALRLHVCDLYANFSTASGPNTEHTYFWDAGLDWSGVSSRTVYLSLPANNAATGRPTITGTATAGSKLTGRLGTMADADGLQAPYSIQWVRVDGSNETDISGATGGAYTLVAADVRRKVKVKVSFTDALSGKETLTSDAYPASGTITGPISVPGEPTSFMATAGNAAVDLSWAVPASDGGAPITGYQYRHAAGSTVPTSTSWTDVPDGSDAGNSAADETGVTVSSLVNDTQYAFEVRAVNSAGEGDKAGPVTATPTGNAAPEFANATEARSITETVGDAVAAAGDVGAAVTATDAEGDTLTNTLEGADAAKFDIDSASGQIETKAGEQYDREAKASYSVTVKASDPSGGSDTVAVTIAVDNVVEKPVTPEAPTVTVTSGSTTSLDVSWTAPGNEGRPALSGYKLRYRTAGVGAWTDHSHTGVGTSATIASLPETTAYEVQVRAVNADGDGDWSASGSATTGTVVVPGAPRNLMVSAGDAQAVLTWTAPASDGGAPLVKYRYRYAAGSAVPSGVSWRDVPDSADAGASAGDETGVTVTGLVNETQYAFEVQAVNSAGGGAAAGPATATPAANPDAPSQVVDLRAVVSGNTVELTWAAPERRGRGKIARYEYRHAAGSAVPSGTAWRSAEARRFPGAYVDGLQNGRRHVFEVRAVNAGAIEGPAAKLAATPRAQAAQSLPTAPRGLRAEGSLYSGMALGLVKLSWEAPSDLGNTHLIRYEYRYAARGASLSSAAWIHGPASERTTTVRNLAVGTSYVFELRAVTLAGAGAAASVGVSTPRSTRLSLSVFTRGSAVEGERLTIGVRRSSIPDPAAAVLVVVEVYDSALSRPSAKAVDIAVGAHEGTVEFAVPFDGARGAARELAVTLHPGSSVLDHDPDGVYPKYTYRVGTPSRATVRVRNMDPLLSVRDAAVREGPGASLSFAVTLDRAAPGTVTVDYATSDGTATAGSDYTAKSGMVTIAAGARRAAIEVAVLDDAVDEGSETMTLTLSNARGAALDDARARGTITNSDPLQKMWLSRFGRTVSGHVVDAVSGRLSGPLAGAQVTVGGQRVELSGADDEVVVAQVLTVLARALGAADAREPDGEVGPARRMTGRELVLGSAFHVASGGERAGGPGFAAWGRVTTGGFDGEGESGAVRIDGEVSTGILGADAAWDGWLAGVAVSLSEGEGEYAYSGVGAGRVESTLTNVSPYVRLDLNERVSTWGLLGYGTGEMTITEAATEDRPREQVTRTGIAMRLGALGVRGALARPEEAGGLDVALRADAFVARTEWDAFVARTEWDAVSNERDRQADASRVRFIVEGARAFVLGGGAVLTPSLELGLRHDGGDAETGTGVELGGGVRYADAASGFSVEARARTLIAHEDSGYEEWGASASVRLDPGASGRGLSFTLSPTVGAASSGVARLWSLADARALEFGGERFEASRRLEAELGYGVGAFGGLSTPYAGLSLGDGGGRTWRSGVRFSFGQAFNLGLEGSRSETGDEADHAMRLRCAMRW